VHRALRIGLSNPPTATTRRQAVQPVRLALGSLDHTSINERNTMARMTPKAVHSDAERRRWKLCEGIVDENGGYHYAPNRRRGWIV